MQTKSYLLLISLMNFFTINSYAQTSTYSRKIVDTLSSNYFWGRGYTNDGLKKAANFLANQLDTIGVNPMKKKSWFQEYSFSVNTFPSNMNVSINGLKLNAGKDFIVDASSKGIVSKGKLIKISNDEFINEKKNIRIKLMNKLTMSVSQSVDATTDIFINKNNIDTNLIEFYDIDVSNKFVKNFSAVNICGIVKGTTKPDSLIIITAHYDHLGGLGNETFFPGANDNASGVSLLLSLAKYYVKNPQQYSIGFILFSGEEAGLLGSKYFTENPLINLSKIRFLINTDLAGTGVDGVTIVNATEFTSEFDIIKKINDENNYFKIIKSRGKAANSDHYFFTEKGVPSFFLYTLGGIKAYHDVDDVAITLPLDNINNLEGLIKKFISKLQSQ